MFNYEVEEEIELFAHEKLVEGKIESTFICCHDDEFGRELTMRELTKIFSGYHFSITPISMVDNKINVFVVKLMLEKRIDDMEEYEHTGVTGYFEKKFFSLINSYYEVNPIKFNPVITLEYNIVEEIKL